MTPVWTLREMDLAIQLTLAQIAVYSRGLGPHHVRDQQQRLAGLHRRLDDLEAERRTLEAGS